MSVVKVGVETEGTERSVVMVERSDGVMTDSDVMAVRLGNGDGVGRGRSVNRCVAESGLQEGAIDGSVQGTKTDDTAESGVHRSADVEGSQSGGTVQGSESESDIGTGDGSV